MTQSAVSRVDEAISGTDLISGTGLISGTARWKGFPMSHAVKRASLPGPRLGMYFLQFSIIFAGLTLGGTAEAQVSFIGATGSINFGSQPIGSPSSEQVLNFQISSGTTVGSIGVLTLGAANLDFSNATDSTCTAATYASTVLCTVNVVFTPAVAGLRMGAVVFFTGTGNTGTVLANVPVYGIGAGAQIAYSPGAATAIAPTVSGKKLNAPNSVAVDGAGNVFIADGVNNRVIEVYSSGAASIAIAPTVGGKGFWHPEYLALDGAGDLFVSDYSNKRIVEIPAGGGAATAITPAVNGQPFPRPGGLVTDGAGDLFVSDPSNNRVLEIPAGGGAVTTIAPVANGVGLNFPVDLAMDGAGDLFVEDYENNRVVEIPVGGGSAIAIDPTVNGKRLLYARGVAVDGAGNLFISDTGNSRVIEVPASGSAAVLINPTVNNKALSDSSGLALDSAGDLFIDDSALNRIVAIQRSQTPALSFSTATMVGATDSSDGTQTVQVQNIGNKALTFTDVSYPDDFSSDTENENTCTNSTSLSQGQACEVPVQFSPLNSGSLSENITLTNNALNSPAATQSIPVSGTGAEPAVLTSPEPDSVLPGSVVTFTWSTGVGATAYQFWASEAWIGGHDLYNSGATKATSVTVNLPTNGVTLFVRLSQRIGGVWQFTDYRFTEAGTPTLAALISPVPGTVLPGSNVTFAWLEGGGPTSYQLWLGTSENGSHDLFESGPMPGTAVNVANIPANGARVFARLFQFIDRKWQYTDATYTAAGTLVQAEITSPIPGSVLPGSSLTFSWSGGNAATAYQLILGTTGPGSYNLYNSKPTKATQVAVSGLPASCITIYAELGSFIDGKWQLRNYTYVAHSQVDAADTGIAESRITDH